MNPVEYKDKPEELKVVPLDEAVRQLHAASKAHALLETKQAEAYRELDRLRKATEHALDALDKAKAVLLVSALNKG